jgi:hypothetical protein
MWFRSLVLWMTIALLAPGSILFAAQSSAVLLERDYVTPGDA